MKKFTLIRYPKNPILERNTKIPWSKGSVLNPTVWFEDGIFKMAYRATNDVYMNEAGRYMSSIGYAESKDGIHFKAFSKPLISPDKEFEMKLGCEDPRITKINGKYFLYYAAVGEGVPGIHYGLNVRIALATSLDLKIWNKHGIVGPKNSISKAAFLFPEKIKGKYVMFYTLNADSSNSSIMCTEFDSLDEVIKPPATSMVENGDLENYEKNVVFRPSKNSFRGPEAGAVPVKTDNGWLMIYCPENATKGPLWTIGAALLDLKNPRKILAQTVEPILTPETESELKGVVNNVTFPEGAVVVGNDLFVYYGSGDQGICLATCNINDLISNFKN